jgi:hypothetical protein
MTVMRPVDSTKNNGQIVLAKQNYSKEQLIAALKKRWLRAPRLSWTLSRLMNLPQKKFDSYMRLFDMFGERMEQSSFPTYLDLTLPRLRVLMTIDVDKLIGREGEEITSQVEKSQKEVTDACYFPERGVVTLKDLIYIHNKYRHL